MNIAEKIKALWEQFDLEAEIDPEPLSWAKEEGLEGLCDQETLESFHDLEGFQDLFFNPHGALVAGIRIGNELAIQRLAEERKVNGS